MTTINPYLNFNGNTEEAFNFYKSVFGGEFLVLQRFKETPHAHEVPADVQDKIMHVALPIGQGNILMASDTLESLGHPMTVGTNFSLSINTASEAEADHIFNGLAAGGQVTMPLDKVFWGDYFGMLTDRFGIQWMVSYSYEKQK
ncbi:VOC family protein [Paraflavisolibacter sp. H34]|uniref:VOC family protein n=1 Tax=Huijunlia imazamoxiresistens TaxID=3127457 RepID=UPI0030177171